MSGNKYPRGSEWRKWDLHVHTPESYENSFANWNSYVEALENVKDVAVIGITDYFFIDGYKKICELKAKDKLKNFELILPNIELRLGTFIPKRGDGTSLKRLNFHVIFSDAVNPEIIETQFVNALHFQIDGATDGNPGDRNLTRQAVEEAGRIVKRYQSDFSNDSDFVAGCKTITVDINEVQKLLSKDCFENRYLLILAAENWDQINWTQDYLTRRNILQKAHGLFCGQQSTIDWCLGHKDISPDAFVKEFGKLKPCVHGSDAHREEDICKPKDSKFCWIKADPTFEGLKQITYEPNDRIRIQESAPDNKTQYTLIDVVEFRHSHFRTEPILLNRNLNIVIGGRSTGKSIFLRSIARAIDSQQVKVRLDEVGAADYLADVLVNVKWADGSDSDGKNIVYLPQTYLNKLLFNNDSRDKVEWEKLIEHNILDDEHLLIEEFKSKKQNIIGKIQTDLTLLFDVWKARHDLKSKIAEIGSKNNIENEIHRIEAEISALGPSSVTADDVAKFNSISTQIQAENNAITAIDLLISQVRGLLQVEFFSDISLSPQLSELFDFKLVELKTKFKAEVQVFVRQAETELLSGLASEKVILERLNKELAPLSIKISGNKILADNNNLIKIQRDKLSRCIELNSQIEQNDKKFAEILKQLWKKYQEIFYLHSELISTINVRRISKKSVELSMHLSFRYADFGDALSQFFDMRKFDSSDLSFLHEYKFESPESHIQAMQKAFDITYKLIESSTSKILKNGRKFSEFISQFIFHDWLVYEYKIRYDGDEISQMSPGKKAIVLLKLFVELNDNQWPILIDQPEDDLDSRSIYSELCEYIKTKKLSRQIILVTHNPNLLIGADAECVIVANQDIGNPLVDNASHRFEYISGSIENTFIADSSKQILCSQGIREHICDILEGGEVAFRKREAKYCFDNK